MSPGKIAYWVSTTLLCLIYLTGAAIYLANRPMVEEGFVYLGYPAYLVAVLIGAKIAAVLAILTRLSVRLSDLAYAGMFFHLLLALSAHLNAGDGSFAPALIGLALLLVSFFSQNRGRQLPSPNVPARFGISARGAA